MAADECGYSERNGQVRHEQEPAEEEVLSVTLDDYSPHIAAVDPDSGDIDYLTFEFTPTGQFQSGELIADVVWNEGQAASNYRIPIDQALESGVREEFRVETFNGPVYEGPLSPGEFRIGRPHSIVWNVRLCTQPNMVGNCAIALASRVENQ